MLKNTIDKWGVLAKTFHWLIALLIIMAMVLGFMAEEWPMSPEKLSLFVWHKTIGISILILMILRLIWKLVNPKPRHLEGISKSNATLADIGHYFLYFLLLFLPSL